MNCFVGVKNSADTARLFFAAWPAPEVQRAMHELARHYQSECGGRAIPERNLHLTLAFLGNIERAGLAGLKACAAGISVTACDLAIDRVGYWRHNRIVWAGVDRCPAALPALAAALASGLRTLGYELDSRAYVPHVTLLRDARRTPGDPAVPAIEWPVRDFALVESVPRGQGRVYEVLRRWPLANV
jgi:RNA 2',3'-cyclic 3'-phosphodiesterase